jgi:hypothetical protein
MVDLYLKALQSERRRLWATCRMKGLAKDTLERQRIVELDRLIATHQLRPNGAGRTGRRGGDSRSPSKD